VKNYEVKCPCEGGKMKVGQNVFQLERDYGANMCDIVGIIRLEELGICKVSSIDHPLPLGKIIEVDQFEGKSEKL
jgi:hypothetical protein